MSEELRKALKEKSLTLGTEQTLKKLKNGEVKTVFLASNCPEQIRTKVEHYCKVSGAKVVELDLPDKEIGLLCRKQYNVAVLSY